MANEVLSSAPDSCETINWRETMETFILSEYVPEEPASLVTYASTPEEAVEHIMAKAKASVE